MSGYLTLTLLSPSLGYTADYASSYQNNPEYIKQRLLSSYFKGLRGLSKEDREYWDETASSLDSSYLDSDINYKDFLFRKSLFEYTVNDLYELNKEDETLKDIHDRMDWYMKDENTVLRNIAMANLANAYDIDGLSEYEGNSFIGEGLLAPIKGNRDLQNTIYAKSNGSLRESANEYLNKEVSGVKVDILKTLNSLNTVDLLKLIDYLDLLSEEASPYYSWYKDTDKINKDRDSKLDKLAEFYALNLLGAGYAAMTNLNNSYLNEVAGNLSPFEKIVNTAQTFITDMATLGITAAGITAGVFLGWSDFIDSEEGGSWLNNIVDNSITRYANDVMSTGIWFDSDRRKRAKELGMSDMAILDTVEQLNSLLSSNTLYNVIGLYGFTVGSTIASFGATGLVKGLTGGLAKIVLISKAAKLMSTGSAVKWVDFFKKARTIGYSAVPGMVGFSEGVTEALSSKEEFMRNTNSYIDEKYQNLAIKDMLEYCLLQGMTEELAALYMQDNMESYVDNYKDLIEEEKALARDKADGVMYTNLFLNACINGPTNYLFKASLMHPRVLDAMAKMGLKPKSAITEAVDIVEEAGKYLAKEKAASALKFFGSKVKTSIGEGIEEFSLNLSNLFSLGVGDYWFKDALYNKRIGKTSSSLMEDISWFLNATSSGLSNAGEALLSLNAWKEFLYGALSTFIGGPNIVTHVDPKTGNTKMRIGWNTALAPLLAKMPGIGNFMSKITGNEIEALNLRNKHIADELNKFFSDKKILEVLFNSSTLAEFMGLVSQALEHNDEKAARDGILGTFFGMQLVLNSLKGTEYYDAVMKNLNAILDFKEENLFKETEGRPTAESTTVAEFLKHPMEIGASNSDPDARRKEVLLVIKDRAKKFLEYKEYAELALDEIERIFGGNVDRNVVSEYIYRTLDLKDKRERVELLLKEYESLRSLERKDSKRRDNLVLSDLEKKAVASYGSLEKAIEAISELRNGLTETLNKIDNYIESLLERIKKRKALKGKEDAKTSKKDIDKSIEESKRAIKDAKLARKKVKRAISTLDSNMSVEELKELVEQDKLLKERRVRFLTAQLLLELDAEILDAMIDNMDNYSTVLQEELNKVLRLGRKGVKGNFRTKLKDLGRLKKDILDGEDVLYDIMTNKEAREMYAWQASYLMLKKVAKYKYKDLVDKVLYKNDEDAINALNNIIEEASDTELEAIKELFKEKNKMGLYNRLLSRKVEKRLLINDIERQLKRKANNSKTELEYNDYTKNSEVFKLILNAISKYDIKLTNPDLVINFIKALLLQGNDILLEIRESTELTNELLYNIYSMIINSYNRENEEILMANTPSLEFPEDKESPSSELTTVDEDKPIKDKRSLKDFLSEQEEVLLSNKVVSALRKELEKLLKLNFKLDADSDEIKLLIKAIWDNDNISDINKLILLASILYTSIALEEEHISGDIKDNIKKIALGAVFKLLSEIGKDNSLDTIEDLDRVLSNIIGSLVDEYNEDYIDLFKNTIYSKVILKIRNIAKATSSDILSDLNNIALLYARSNKKVTLWGNFMNSLSIAYMLKMFPDSVISKYLKRHKVSLNISRLSEKENYLRVPVYFITDSLLTLALRDSYGKYLANVDIPIVAVVEDSNGDIIIGDKKYAAIAVMPSSNNPNVNGISFIGMLRNLAIHNTEGILFIKDELGLVLESSLSSPALSILIYDKDKQGRDTNVLDIIKSDSLESSDPEGYTEKAKRHVATNLKVLNSPFKVVYNISDSSGNKPTVRAIPVKKTTNKEGKTIELVIKEINKPTDPSKIPSLEDFNGRTAKLHSRLGSLLKELKSSPISTVSKGGITTVTDEEGLIKKIKFAILDVLRLKNGYIYKTSVTNNKGERQVKISIYNETNLTVVDTIITLTLDNNNKLSFDVNEALKSILNTAVSGEVERFEWDLNIPDIKKANGADNKGASKEAKNAAKNVLSMVEDGIFTVDASTLTFKPEYGMLSLDAPKLFKLKRQSETLETKEGPVEYTEDDLSKDDDLPKDDKKSSISDIEIEDFIKHLKSKLESFLKNKLKIQEGFKDYPIFEKTLIRFLYSNLHLLEKGEYENIELKIKEFLKILLNIEIEDESWVEEILSIKGYYNDVISILEDIKLYSAFNLESLFTFKPGTIIDGIDVGGKDIEYVYKNIVKKSDIGEAPAKDSIISVENPDNYITTFKNFPEEVIGVDYGADDLLPRIIFKSPNGNIGLITYDDGKGKWNIFKQTTKENGEKVFYATLMPKEDRDRIVSRIVPKGILDYLNSGKIEEDHISDLLNGTTKVDDFFRENYNVHMINEYYIGTGNIHESFENFYYYEGYLPLLQEWANLNPEIALLFKDAIKGIKLDYMLKNTVNPVRALLDINIPSTPKSSSSLSLPKTPSPSSNFVKTKEETVELVTREIEGLIGKHKHYTLDANEEFYEYRLNENSKNPDDILARVTSLIKSMRDVKENDEGALIFKIPSTTIGNWVDKFFRDYIDHLKLGGTKDSFIKEIDKGDRKYSNLFVPGSIDYIHLCEKIDRMLEGFKNKGLKLTFFPKDITVLGVIKLDNGKTIRAAGTLDLLAVDQEGKIHIFDMKTKRGTVYESDMVKWSKQLLLYASFLQQSIGIKVEIGSLNIIPISVKYPDPRGETIRGKEYTPEYRVNENGVLEDTKNTIHPEVLAHPTMFSKGSLFVTKKDSGKYKRLTAQQACYDESTGTISISLYLERKDSNTSGAHDLKSREENLTENEKNLIIDNNAIPESLKEELPLPTENPLDGDEGTLDKGTLDLYEEMSKDAILPLEKHKHKGALAILNENTNLFGGIDLSSFGDIFKEDTEDQELEDKLKAKGITKELFNNMDDSQKDVALNC